MHISHVILSFDSGYNFVSDQAEREQPQLYYTEKIDTIKTHGTVVTGNMMQVQKKCVVRMMCVLSCEPAAMKNGIP
jgi:hypothetical protein